MPFLSVSDPSAHGPLSWAQPDDVSLSVCTPSVTAAHCSPLSPTLPPKGNTRLATYVIGFVLLSVSENTAGATLNYLIEASGFKLLQFAINNEKHADFSCFFNMKALKCFMDLYPHHSKFWLTIRRVFNNHKWNGGFHSGLGRL